MSKIFSRADGLKPGKSFFKGLSHSKTFTCDMGQDIPILYLECYPGDVMKIGSEVVVRFMPMVAPILHEVNVIENYFFVPYRLLSDENFDWDTFITGGKDGDGKLNGVEQVLPRWDVSNDKHDVGSLWDYFCFSLVKPVASCLPYDFPRRAYNLIHNQYIRDENTQAEVSLANEDILYRCWKKDYFTSALISQQRGQAPALPGDIMYLGTDGAYHSLMMYNVTNSSGVASSLGYVKGDSSQTPRSLDVFATGPYSDVSGDLTIVNPSGGAQRVVYTGADVADMRLSFQVQKWMERNNRGGYRYTEVIRSHFGVAPADERMQRAEYIGGCVAPLIVREVLQTSQTVKTEQSLNPSVQGNMAGHGISANAQYIGKYRVKEHGCIIGIMSIMPKPMYMSQGIERQFLRRSRFDFYWPEFSNLSEQAVENVEICATGTDRDFGVFGFQGRFNELRWQGDKVAGLMRKGATDGGFAFWHLARMFDPSEPPSLNGTFMSANNIRKDFLAVPGQPACVVSYGNVIHALRPMPKMPIPGLIDHH